MSYEGSDCACNRLSAAKRHFHYFTCTKSLSRGVVTPQWRHPLQELLWHATPLTEPRRAPTYAYGGGYFCGAPACPKCSAHCSWTWCPWGGSIDKMHPATGTASGQVPLHYRIVGPRPAINNYSRYFLSQCGARRPTRMSPRVTHSLALHKPVSTPHSTNPASISDTLLGRSRYAATAKS